MEKLNDDDAKLQAVLDLLRRRGRLTMTYELLQRYLAWRGKGASMGAAIMRGGLLSSSPFEMAMLFASERPGPLPPDDELWAIGEQAQREHEARRRRDGLERAQDRAEQARTKAERERLARALLRN
jgi:hypothetical protein